MIFGFSETKRTVRYGGVVRIIEVCVGRGETVYYFFIAARICIYHGQHLFVVI